MVLARRQDPRTANQMKNPRHCQLATLNVSPWVALNPERVRVECGSGRRWRLWRESGLSR
jgi:hypothetical protein